MCKKYVIFLIIVIYQEQKKPEDKVELVRPGFLKPKVEAVPYFTKQVMEVQPQIDELLEQLSAANAKSCAITFKAQEDSDKCMLFLNNLADAKLAADKKAKVLRAHKAPLHTETLWKNVGVSLGSRRGLVNLVPWVLTPLVLFCTMRGAFRPKTSKVTTPPT